MYDILGDLVVFPSNYEPQWEELLFLLKKGYKKIYKRSKIHDQHRISDLIWLSPYPELPNSSKFFHKEGGFIIYGDLKQAYYSPRYAKERSELFKLLKNLKESYDLKTLDLVGSGISPFSLYLHQIFNIEQYEINERAIHFGSLNLRLNNLEPLKTFQLYHNSRIPDVLIAMIPAETLEFHKNYLFEKILVLYLLTDSSLKELTPLREHYKATILDCKNIRPYHKGYGVYRIILKTLKS